MNKSEENNRKEFIANKIKRDKEVLKFKKNNPNAKAITKKIWDKINPGDKVIRVWIDGTETEVVKEIRNDGIVMSNEDRCMGLPYMDNISYDDEEDFYVSSVAFVM